ncbi:MAG TPA: histidine phosphatase family protein [Silvibacterium sp.]|jgi:alpha-ribazole phosphatase/probable phosphoglycerate mutase|nr:histidine phosphatase family protein [Silvibacterium sp.]
MTNTLLFIRHAETDLAGRFCGHSNPPVNERGHLQIEGLLGALQNESIDAVYTSDLSRALTTADAIARAFRLLPVTVPELREINFGEWEGLNWQEIESRDAVYARRWSESYPQLPAPGGESFEAFQSRVMIEVEHLLSLQDQKCLAIVTHGGVMQVVLRVLCGLDEDAAWEQTKSYCGFFRYPQTECR